MKRAAPKTPRRGHAGGRYPLAVLALLAGMAAGAPSGAAEVDSVTTRGVLLDDSADAVNAIVNQRLLEGIAGANVADEDIDDTDPDEFCDEDRLFAALRRGIFQSLIPRWGLRGYDLDRQMRELLAPTSYSLSLQDSVYRDMNYLEGFSLRAKGLSDVIRVDGHLVGLDKIGHFFSEGWAYFEQTRSGDRTLEEALRRGGLQESGKYGYATTGIFSFADLVANFNGWRFWNSILGHHDDPTLGIVGNWLAAPRVSCELRVIASFVHRRVVRAWRLNRRFDIRDYVDGAWDEGINCNSFADPLVAQKVDSRIVEIRADFSCPADPGECSKARQRYGTLSRYLLHPRCLTPVSARPR